MKLLNPIMIGQIEDRADLHGRGSVWRACLAIQRCCYNKNLGKMLIQLAYRYAMGGDTLNTINSICNDLLSESKGEIREAFQALKNAIEMAPDKAQTGIHAELDVEKRNELWERLNRLIK